ncbi:hypothetical protein A1D22_10220 [Pasteurellaceae bacterium LFhippo2]|nr:hypothetical protein [Pasteurellaceae bacterium LFhippo2]
MSFGLFIVLILGAICFGIYIIAMVFERILEIVNIRILFILLLIIPLGLPFFYQTGLNSYSPFHYTDQVIDLAVGNIGYKGPGGMLLTLILAPFSFLIDCFLRHNRQNGC